VFTRVSSILKIRARESPKVDFINIAEETYDNNFFQETVVSQSASWLIH